LADSRLSPSKPTLAYIEFQSIICAACISLVFDQRSPQVLQLHQLPLVVLPGWSIIIVHFDRRIRITCSEIIDIRTEMMAINDVEKTNVSNQTLRNGELNPHQQHYD
jgi:hypothetical protein